MQHPLTAALLLSLAMSGQAYAQSTGASPADPNNERNQRMAPSNTQPADPAASDTPTARVPTDPQDARSAESEEGGATGTRIETPGPVIPGPAVTPPPPE